MNIKQVVIKEVPFSMEFRVNINLNQNKDIKLNNLLEYLEQEPLYQARLLSLIENQLINQLEILGNHWTLVITACQDQAEKNHRQSVLNRYYERLKQIDNLSSLES